MKRAPEDGESQVQVGERNEGEGSSVPRRPPAGKRAKRPRLKWGLRRGPITGLRGVLATCAVGSEQRCANEISQFLDTIAARMLGEDAEDETEGEVKHETEGEAKHETEPQTGAKKPTLEEMLAAERAAMTSEGDSGCAGAGAGAAARLQAMYSGVNGVIFVRVLRDALSPTALCHAAAVAAARADCPMRLRQTVRVIPLEKTCQVNCADITHTLAPLLLRTLLPEVAAASASASAAEGTEAAAAEGATTVVKRPGTTYHVEFRSRNCSAVHRQDGINAVLHAMPDAALFARAGVCAPVVQFKGSEVAVIVELFKSTCGVAVAPDFDRLKQYNLRALQDEALLATIKPANADGSTASAPSSSSSSSPAPAADTAAAPAPSAEDKQSP